MFYRVCLYNCSSYSPYCLGTINAQMSDGKRYWEREEALSYIVSFNTEEAISLIKNRLGDLCKVQVVHPSREDPSLSYLLVITSYQKAKRALPKLYAVAAEYGLVLYDIEQDNNFVFRAVKNGFIDSRNRLQTLKGVIRESMVPVRKIREVFSYHEYGKFRTVIGITLTKDTNKAFLERVEDFYRLLQSHLIEGEDLICEDHAFKVSAEKYELICCLEGYKKRADRIGYVENGIVKEKLSRRMSLETAFCWIEQCTEREKADIFKRMRFLEMCYRYPNPLDRLAASVRITKWQRRQLFHIRYSGFGYYGSEICFHVDTDRRIDSDKVSVLKVEEDTATFLLPFLREVCPEYWGDYYGTSHIPSRAFREIIDRLEEAKDMMINRPYGTSIERYLKRFNLFLFPTDREDPDCWEYGDGMRIKYMPKEFFYPWRYEAAKIIDAFLDWFNVQIDLHDHLLDECYLVVTGP